MAEKKVYSTTVLGAKPHRGRPAQGSEEVSGNVEYKESKSKTPRTEEEKKAIRTIQAGTVGAFAAGVLASTGADAARDYSESRRYRNRAGRRRQRILKPDNIQ
jgi:hypothetical protein